MGKHENALRTSWPLPELIADSTGTLLRDNFTIIGDELDGVDSSAQDLLYAMFPDTDSTSLITNFEKTFSLSDNGTISQRQARIVGAHRARGGLSKDYFETLGNSLTDGTVTITEGSGQVGFIIHDNPTIATSLPGVLYDTISDSDSPYYITVEISGSTLNPETELENKFNKLKPAHTKFVYNYV